MRQVLFRLKSYVDNAIREAGSVHWISDHHALHEHMVDVDADKPGEHPAPADHMPQFLDHSGDTRLDGDATSQSGGYNPALAERTKDGAG